MTGTKTEIAAGAVTLAAAIGFLAYAAQVTDFAAGRAENYALSASFRSAQGIGPGTEVRLAGIRIGSVTDMALDPETFRAEMRLAIDARYDLPEDSAAAVASEGLLGGSFVEIVPGDSPFRLADGDEIADTRAAQSLIGLLAEFVASTSE